MVETEYEILREKDEETTLGERKPFESNRQATYEDTIRRRDADRVWEDDDTE